MRARLAMAMLCGSAVFLGALVLGPTTILPWGMTDVERQVMLSIRLPRVAVGALMGAALGASGAALQGMLRNPLADPYILGLSSGATLAAAGGLMAGLTFLGPLTIPALAFGGAMATGLIVGVMGYRGGGIWPERLLLAGIGIGFMLSAALMLMMSLSSSEGLKRAVLWIFGDLGIAGWSLVPMGGALIGIGMGLALWRARALNTLVLGEDLSHSLGFSPRREAGVLFVAVGLMTAASVSLGGMVGFIGLLVPHIMRALVGPDHRVLIPAAAVGGGALLVVSDLIGRTIASPAEIPAGIVTALIGAPYFLYLLRRRDILGA